MKKEKQEQQLLTKNNLLDIQRNVYKANYYEFFKEAFKHNNTDEELQDNWHVKELCDQLQYEALRVKNYDKWLYDLIINIPPRHLKTLIANTYFNAWVWTWFPAAKFMAVSYSPDVANEEALRCRNLIKSDWYQTLFPHVKLADDANKIEIFKNTSGGQRKSVGAGNAVTAFGAHFIVCDDIQDPKRANSPTERLATINFYQKTLYNRVNNPSKGHIRINIQQRLHEQDLTGHLLESRPTKHKHICLPAQLTDATTPEYRHFYQDELLFPERFDLEVLDNIKGGQGGSKEYANQYLQQPTPDDGDVFLKDWFTTIEQDAFQKRASGRLEFYIDTAEGTKKHNDASAIVTTMRVGHYLYVLHAVEHRLSPANMAKEIERHVGEWTHNQFNGRVFIEKKSTGGGIIDNLNLYSRVHAQELNPSTRESKLDRNKRATHFCMDKRVIIVRGSWNQNLLDQLTMYPNAKHDDLVDAFCYAVNNFKVSQMKYIKIN